jgi:hypothetical protein
MANGMGAPEANIVQDGEGNLRNASAGQRVFVNGVDVQDMKTDLATQSSLLASQSSLLASLSSDFERITPFNKLHVVGGSPDGAGPFLNTVEVLMGTDGQAHLQWRHRAVSLVWRRSMASSMLWGSQWWRPEECG